jgi:hypothetical protein
MPVTCCERDRPSRLPWPASRDDPVPVADRRPTRYHQEPEMENPDGGARPHQDVAFCDGRGGGMLRNHEIDTVLDEIGRSTRITARVSVVFCPSACDTMVS